MKLPDLLIERSKLLKNVLLWKIAFILSITLLLGLFFKDYLKSNKSISKDYNNKNIIGVIEIDDKIKDIEKFHIMLDDIENTKSIKALVVNINSPGGSTGTFEKIYHKLNSIKAKKPVVAVMGNVAASGGYMASLASDKIYALNLTITGSIGVISMYPELVGLAEKLGIKFIQMKSSKLKAAPNPFEELTDEIKDARMTTIMDTYDYFVEIVAKERKLPLDEVKKFADGRVFTGRQALKLKMIDEIGTTENAIEWLKKDKKINENAVLKNIKPKNKNDFLEMLVNNIDNSSKLFVDYFWSKLISSRYETQ